jgi:hypothetical protein
MDTKKPPINKKRLWLLLSSAWAILVLISSYNHVVKGIERSESAFGQHKEEVREMKFYACLEEQGTSYGELISRQGEKCENQVREICNSIFCNRDLIYKLCIRNSSEECRYLYAATSLEKFYSLEEEFSRVKEKFLFYIVSSYSRPLKISFLLLIFVPLIMLFLPRVFLMVSKWLRG